MVFNKKGFLTQMRFWIILIVTVVSIYSDIPKYADAQIITILKHHFQTINHGPTYLGQSIYKENNQRVFQLEIGSPEEKVDDYLLYSFNTLTKISSYASNPYNKFVLIIHVDKYDIPVIASSKFTCCKTYFVDNTMTKKQWESECLLLKTL